MKFYFECFSEIAYYIKMTIGQTKRVYKLYIDSGSPFVWLFCNWPKDTNRLQLVIRLFNMQN